MLSLSFTIVFLHIPPFLLRCASTMPAKKTKKSWVPVPFVSDLATECKSLEHNDRPCNGDIIKHYLHCDCSFSNVTSSLLEYPSFKHLSYDCLYHRLNRLIEKLKNLSKNIQREKPSIKSLLSELFNLNTPFNPSKATTAPIPPSTPRSLPLANASNTPPSVRKRDDCQGCISKSVRISTLVSELEKRKAVVKEQRKLTNQVKENYDTKRVNQKLLRKDVQVVNWKSKCSEARTKKAALERQLLLLKKRLESKCEIIKTLEARCIQDRRLKLENDLLQEKNVSLKKEVAELTKQLKSEKLQSDYLHSCLNEKEQNSVSLKEDKKQYNFETRKLVFWFLRENCPVEAIALLISRCAVTFGVELCDSLPVPSTLEAMAWQLGVLADLQV